MKSIMSAVFCVAMALAISGCRYEQTTRFKHMPGISDPVGQLKTHVSYVARGRVQPYYDEWRNVKSKVQKPGSPDQPYTATITAEVYEFDSGTAMSPLVRTDYEISLVYQSSKWALKELKADSGLIGGGGWQSKGSKAPVLEGSTRWKQVARELELQ